jgi:threonine aldolase
MRSRLARGLAGLGFEVEGAPETNIVMFRVAQDAAFHSKARECGVLLSRPGPGRLRAVTHLDVTAADVDGRSSGSGSSRAATTDACFSRRLGSHASHRGE